MKPICLINSGIAATANSGECVNFHVLVSVVGGQLATSREFVNQ